MQLKFSLLKSTISELETQVMTMRSVLRSPLFVVLLAAHGLAGTVHAASVGAAGYTNSFDTLPAAADWSTASLPTNSADFAAIGTLNTAVQTVVASGITNLLFTEAAAPPAADDLGRWSSTGLYAQSRPTGNGATLIMCTLVNGLAANAGGAAISYDYASTDNTADEVAGHRAYYSRTGAANSWIPITEFSSAVPGQLTANLNFLWPPATTVYVLWADDNGSGSPDTANQIDNFYAATLPFVPVSITNQPQSQTIVIGTPIILSVGAAGTAPAFQWQTNNGAGVWINISGATSAVYSNATTFVGSRDYRVIVSGALNSATSTVATVNVTADNVGPLVLSAIVDSVNNNLIYLTFNENLLANGSATTTNTVDSNVSPGILTNGTFRVVMFGSNVNATVFKSSYNAGVPGTSLPRVTLIMTNNVSVLGTNWFNRTNYYIILNNIRDFRHNIIAPNTIVPVSWSGTTNLLDPNGVSQEWRYHANYYFTLISMPPDPPGYNIYTTAWTTVDFIPDGFWGTTFSSRMYIETGGGTGLCYTNAPSETIGYQDPPSLFRTVFMWSTNANAPTNVDLTFDYGGDDAAAIYLNGNFMFADANFPLGPITQNSRATTVSEGACKTRTIPNVALRRGSNVLAVAVAQLADDPQGDSGFVCKLDAKAVVAVSPLPPWSRTNTLTLTKLTPSSSPTNRFRLSWPTNAYGYALERATNVLGPWSQVQPHMANPYITNATEAARSFYRLQATQ